MLEDITERAARHGIYTLLDMHQDLLSEAFCGEGLPAWAVQTDDGTKPIFRGFPAPIEAPWNRSDDKGFPLRADCYKNPDWSRLYASEATARAFQSFWKNESGIIDAWAHTWAHVAARFRSSSAVIGLELLNEPFPGDFFHDPSLMLPFSPWAADLKNFQPAYETVAKAIRAVDRERIIFFAGATWDDFGSPFTIAPGGSDAAVLAYHYYAPVQLAPTSTTVASVQFEAQMRAARRLGVGAMLTETCGPVNHNSPACTKNSNPVFPVVADAADAFLQSFATWEWKPFCRESSASKSSTSQWAEFGACKTGYGPQWNSTTMLPNSRSSYARTYARFVAGNATKMRFDHRSSTRRFDLEFRIDARGRMPPTEIFASSELHYTDEIAVTVKPDDMATASFDKDTQLLSIMPTNLTRQQMLITVTIENRKS